ncbi:superoxide dismutase family protein [Aquimarina sp. D1M17]|uniref:superoxide dismutase family protein n=1 Tax=Aquimarina acroporae TaxID=2937283 RepID=UPI0020C02C9A|nr:superoxide dismutase family protein [Aquimarina acroporae]MCK8522901.1 superoxide dismutase family protein [Aquimarina acroporae]
MKSLQLIVIVLLSFMVYSCKGEKKESTDQDDITKTVHSTKKKEDDTTKTISFNLDPKSESNVTGKVTFMEAEGIVNMTAELTGLSKGEHAIHIHEKADCSSSDGKSTGGHWNPTLEPHGKWGAKEGFHRGDIGNFKADDEGNGVINFATNEWCIGCDDKKKNILGKAIIVHQGVDDFTSQPSGAAGSRISCGGIIQ